MTGGSESDPRSAAAVPFLDTVRSGGGRFRAPSLPIATHEKHAHLGSRSEPVVRPGRVAAQVLAAFAHSRSGVALIGGEGRFVHVNAALTRMLGRPAAELRLLRWQDVTHPDDVPTGESAVRRALAETEGLDEQIRALRPDGRDVRLRVTARVLPADDGDPALLVAHCEDLDAHEAAARRRPPADRPREPGSALGVGEEVHDLARVARRASAAALQAVVDGVEEAIVCIDEHDIVRFFSPAAQGIWGRDADEVVGRPVWSLAGDDRRLEGDLEAGHLRAELRAGRAELRAGRSVHRETVALRKDGSHVAIRLTAIPILGSGGRYRGAALTALDISELRRAGGDRARLAAFVQAAPDGIITSDRDAIIESWNAGAERMFGLSAEQAIGRVYDDVVIPEGGREASRRLRERVLAGETVTVRMGCTRFDGSVFPAQVSAARMGPDSGHVGMVAIVRDVTELVEAELELRERTRRLERSNADLEAFAYAASHDLQEPLRSIKMGAETLMRAAAERLTDDELGLLGYVDAAASRMSAQVYALMEVARVALAPGSDERTPVQRSLDDALDALRAAIRDTGAQIEVQGPLPVVPVPRAEMSLVLQNLIANAIKFGRQDVRPHVTVSGAVHDGVVEVCVADNGVGLSEADRAQIFKIFGRAHADVPGTGVGLAVCGRILERRGGSISVSSAGPNRGSQFTLRLPVAAP